MQDLAKGRGPGSPGSTDKKGSGSANSSRAGPNSPASPPQKSPQPGSRAARLAQRADSEDEEKLTGQRNPECSHVACSTKVPFLSSHACIFADVEGCRAQKAWKFHRKLSNITAALQCLTLFKHWRQVWAAQ